MNVSAKDSHSDQFSILVSEEPLDIPLLNCSIQSNQGESGASVIFTGNVRVSHEEQNLTGMTLEHYPGMTESLLTEIACQAIKRWQLNKVIVAHRVGYLSVGDPIVFVGACALHRLQAFKAAEYIMDYLKHKATFWKKEHYNINGNGKTKNVWVEAKQSDIDSLKRWKTT